MEIIIKTDENTTTADAQGISLLNATDLTGTTSLTPTSDLTGTASLTPTSGVGVLDPLGPIIVPGPVPGGPLPPPPLPFSSELTELTGEGISV